MDGPALELANDTYDIAGSQYGVMLFPDLPRALREMVRVTAPGGRGLVVGFGPPQRSSFSASLCARCGLSYPASRASQ